MIHKKLREFWIIDSEMINCPDKKTRLCRIENPSIDRVNNKSFIHVREVLPDEPELITDLIHQRSVAWDEYQKWKSMATSLAELLSRPDEDWKEGEYLEVMKKYSEMKNGR